MRPGDERSVNMRDVEFNLKKEIKRYFGIQEKDIQEFTNEEGSNYVYSFIAKGEKYVIKKLNETSILDWKNEKAAYNALKPLNITDELVNYENGIRITRYINNSENLTFSAADQIEALDKIRMIHKSGVSIEHKYDIVENISKCMNLCRDKNTKNLNELKSYRDEINAIQTALNKLNIPPVLCHGDACVISNFLRLSDGSIKLIDWEQAGMADPLLDIAIAAIHQGLENIDPVWSLHFYLERIPTGQEYLRLFSFLALDSFLWMAWYISIEDQEDYEFYLNYAIKYGKLAITYIGE
jgi:thiamine kinase-like enzyme